MVALADPFILKLSRLGKLTDEELRELERFQPAVIAHEADTDLAHEYDVPTVCMLLVEGMVCRAKLLDDGRRQIVSFHMRGDVIDFSSLLLSKLDHTMTTLTPVRVATIPHATIKDWIRRFPNLALLMWRDTLIDAAIYREWVVNVGRRSAYQRIGHVLCELVTRLHCVGLAPGSTFDLPITQAEFADATGLSTVHVNRTLQELRRKGLIMMSGKTLRVLDWDGLQKASSFDGTYLHQLSAA